MEEVVFWSFPICIMVGRQSRQTLAHVLSHCQATLKHDRYNTRHDCPLEISTSKYKRIFPDCTSGGRPGRVFLQATSQPASWGPIFCCTPLDAYTFSSSESARRQTFTALKRLRNKSKYLYLHINQVGCRGFSDTNSLQPRFRLMQMNLRKQRAVMCQIIKTTIKESHTVWTLRNTLIDAEYLQLTKDEHQ